MSEQTNELFASYSKFQGELTNATKSKAGHGYKYADLAQCIETAREPLVNNGLAVSQMIGQSEQGTTLTTILTHSSGQWMRDTFVMEKAVLQGGAGKNPAQAMGASITYMRRYAYAAIIGMTQEDEDAANVREIKRQSSDAIAMINQAIQASDAEYVKSNWQGCIAKVWGQLNESQVNALNNLVNAQ